MKKSTNKLTLQKTTIRLLQGYELAEVVGGGPTPDCTDVQTICICYPDAAAVSQQLLAPTKPAR
jgi:hypothetical protein